MNSMTCLQLKIKELKLTKRILILSGKDVSSIDEEIRIVKDEIDRYSIENQKIVK